MPIGYRHKYAESQRKTNDISNWRIYQPRISLPETNNIIYNQF